MNSGSGTRTKATWYAKPNRLWVDPERFEGGSPKHRLNRGMQRPAAVGSREASVGLGVG